MACSSIDRLCRRRLSARRLLPICLLLFCLAVQAPHTAGAQSEAADFTFAINGFDISGNTVFAADTLQAALAELTGEGRTARDVEQARSLLEKYYHTRGYPTVLVNIPEQTVEDGVVRLDVIESTIRRVRIVGNRYFTMDKILTVLPSFRPGEMLYVPRIQQELAEINRNPDIKVAPLLMPGKELGTIDVELRVKDKLPLHGSLELNNRNTHGTTDLRLNAALRYDNLWQRDHSAALQVQTSPEDTREVRLLVGSYAFPSLWAKENMTVLYALLSDSDNAFAQDFQVSGEGLVIGLREIVPLPRVGDYAHNLTAGMDYKRFEDNLSYGDFSESVPVTYMPLTLSYSATLAGAEAVTRFDTGLNLAFRGLVTRRDEFADKRYKAAGNYVVWTLSLMREQALPLGMLATLKVEGQLADQPLIANEQYSAGGVQSVPGYKESEAAGDHAVYARLGWSGPDLAPVFGLPSRWHLRPEAAYAVADLSKNDPLPGEDRSVTLQGIGAGIRAGLDNQLVLALDWGMALDRTDRTPRGRHAFYFQVRYLF